MLKKIITIFGIFVVSCFVMGTIINWYIERPIKYDGKICHKNKLLTQWEDEPDNIYTQIKGFRCEVDNGILIVEEIGR